MMIPRVVVAVQVEAVEMAVLQLWAKYYLLYSVWYTSAFATVLKQIL